MDKRHPVQSEENPHNIWEQPKAWVDYEYHAQRGSKSTLTEYAKRVNLVSAVENDPAASHAICEALNYLLLESK